MRGQLARCVRSHASVLLRGLGLVVAMGCLGWSRPARAQDEGDDERRREPVRLALEVGYEGIAPATQPPQPLRVKAGQTFILNQIDLRSVVTSASDADGVNGLKRTGSFASLPWSGLKQVDEESTIPGGDGTYTRRRFYRQAEWMEQSSTLTVQPVDSAEERGRPTGRPIVLTLGRGDRRQSTDDFFVRRLRAVQTASGCTTQNNLGCSQVKSFTQEGLVELRNARTGATPFILSRDTRALRIYWSARQDGKPFVVPVEQEEQPTWAYGASVEVKALTAPRYNGTYAAGTAITFQLTLRDGAGKRLHPQGSLPTYNQYRTGAVASGIQYYRAFFEPTTTYYLRKHRERMLMTQIIGPTQKIQPIRSIVELDAFLFQGDVQTVGTLERDGVFSQFQTFPPSPDLFGGAFLPGDDGWDAPVSDTWTYTLPRNATPGTYLVTVKGRRVYLGEDIPFSQNLSIQVETPRPSEAQLATGPCTTCHSEGGELSKVLHANDNRAACNGCHAPLGFELEGPIYVRTHFLHSRSGRFDSPLQQCGNCHLKAESIQRTSKSACLSCHKSYPDSHVKDFGPVQSMYVGGGRESFQQCTGTCHKTHPGSNL